MKRRTAASVGATIALVAAAAIAGPIIYAKTQDDAPPPLSVTTSTPAPTTQTPVTQALATDGTWVARPGSQAGYRVDEVLNGQNVTVVGRTDEVTAEIRIESAEVISTEVIIDIASISTDSSSRDSYFRDEALKVDTYPDATFTLDVPIPLPDIGAEPVEVTAEGQLTLTGAANDVKFKVTVVRTERGMAVSGAIPITFEDYGISAPSLGFVKVEDSGTVEFLINLEK